MTTPDTKLETVDSPRPARLGVRMQLGVNGARRSAADVPGARPAPKRMQLGISGARRAQFETRVAPTEPQRALVELGCEVTVELAVATIAAPTELVGTCASTLQRAPIELGSEPVSVVPASAMAAMIAAQIELGTCPP